MSVRPHCGEMHTEHIPGWRERAMLQSLKPEAVRFPPETTETQKRQLSASVVPPLFAACLSTRRNGHETADFFLIRG